MQFDEMGNKSGKTLMLLPGTACDYQTNFAAVLDRLGAKYHLICVNYDGFDGSGSVFPDMITEHTRVHFIYAKKMGEKYLKRYKKYFRDPDIREFDMQHEQWLFGGEQYTLPVLSVIDEFMGMPV